MKLTSVLLLGFLCMAFQEPAFSQQARVNMEVNQQPLNDVLKELGRQTGLNFLYHHEMVREKGNVSVKAANKELGQLLDELLPALGLEHVFRDRGVVIREKPAAQQERRVVSGKVTDAAGAPLPGVTVRL
ncbi:MAG: SusC/RagA family TonB-linked outer membrane protein, partial [Odoribacteraceae bacterium]|nr:SusC/RagA family TonB-linked outer membrane protein [Odoribacteraceae bacterium]